MKRCVVYTRVSTSAQSEQGTSLAAQYAACLTKAQQIGATVVNHFSDTQSGADYADREGLQAALAEIESGRADTLIIYDMSRYSRDLEHQQIIRKRVAACDGRLVFCTLDVGDLKSPESHLSFGVSGVFAEYERLKIRERTTQGRRSRAESNIQPCRGRHPYGYHIVTKSDVIEGQYGKNEIGHYVLVEEEAAVVREMFERYNRGHSLRSICRWLTLEGPPSPRHGRQWGASTVRRILGNEVYKGKATFGRLRRVVDERRIAQGFNKATLRANATYLSIDAPAIVSEEVWQAAQERATRNRHLLSGHHERTRMLSGLLRCPLCGGSMVGKYNGNQNKRVDGSRAAKVESRWIYKCVQEFARLDPAQRCVGFSVRAEIIEQAVLEAVISYIDPAVLAAYWKGVARRAKSKNGEKKTSLTVLDRKLKALHGKESLLVAAQLRALEAGASSVVYEERLRDLTVERQSLEAQRKDLERVGQKKDEAWPRAVKVSGKLAEIRDVLESPDVTGAEKRNLLALVVERIVPGGQQVEITFK